MESKELTASYTKGEWYLQEYTDAYTHIVRCNNGKGHETIFIAATPQSTLPEARANAKLMAAAPDLLESLQEIIAITDRDHVAWAKAKAAIDKALARKEGKEVEATVEIPKVDLGTCVECGTRQATTDYNGHLHNVCEPCNNRLNREFDNEYK